MTEAETEKKVDIREASITPLQLKVEQAVFVQPSDLWKEESVRLAGEIAEAIRSQFQSFNPGREVLIAEISGFPGLSEIAQQQTEAAFVSDNLQYQLPKDIVDALHNKGIIASTQDLTTVGPRGSAQAVRVRQYATHDKTSQAQDVGSLTTSYQRSVWQYFVTVVPES